MITVDDWVCDRTFLGHCLEWQKEGRCPEGMVSWLFRRTVYASPAYRAASWAREQADCWGSTEIGGDGRGSVRPHHSPYDDTDMPYTWCRLHAGYVDPVRSAIPADVYDALPDRESRFDSFAGAVAALFVAWEKARP